MLCFYYVQLAFFHQCTASQFGPARDAEGMSTQSEKKQCTIFQCLLSNVTVFTHILDSLRDMCRAYGIGKKAADSSSIQFRFEAEGLTLYCYPSVMSPLMAYCFFNRAFFDEYCCREASSYWLATEDLQPLKRNLKDSEYVNIQPGENSGLVFSGSNPYKTGSSFRFQLLVPSRDCPGDVISIDVPYDLSIIGGSENYHQKVTFINNTKSQFIELKLQSKTDYNTQQLVMAGYGSDGLLKTRVFHDIEPGDLKSEQDVREFAVVFHAEVLRIICNAKRLARSLKVRFQVSQIADASAEFSYALDTENSHLTFYAMPVSQDQQ